MFQCLRREQPALGFLPDGIYAQGAHDKVGRVAKIDVGDVDISRLRYGGPFLHWLGVIHTSNAFVPLRC